MPDIKDDRTLSWYHLASPAPRGSRPLGVQAYACAMTGAPVAAYTEPVVGARLRDHVQRGLRTPSHQAGALFDGRPGLLFSSLPLRCYAAMDTVYVSFRPPSTTNFAQNPGASPRRPIPDALHSAGTPCANSLRESPNPPAVMRHCVQSWENTLRSIDISAWFR